MAAKPSVPLIGYSDRLSVCPGQSIGFKVSSDAAAPFSARLVRIICADPNPDGPGLIEQDVEAAFAGDYPSRVQVIHAGSYGRSLRPLRQTGDGSVTLEATIWPTLPGKGAQVVLAYGDVALMLGADGGAAGAIAGRELSTGQPLKPRHWYRLTLRYDASAQELCISQQELKAAHPAQAERSLSVGDPRSDRDHPVLIAARQDGEAASGHFNGKIESPAIYFAAVPDGESLAARWDFARDTSTTYIRDVGPHGLDGELVNLPARAMTGAAWDGSETCWRHAPAHYGAIHFHDDDVYDFGWETDFVFDVPDDLSSGIYAARIRCGAHEDAMPFFVCPPPGKRSADLCVIVPTFTYVIYGNHGRPDFVPGWKERMAAWQAYPWNAAEHRDLGLSTYNDHGDGSGICHASHRRPLLTLRPGYLTFGYGEGSGLRHFQADSHLIAWLHAKNYAYDIVTDHELHEEGVARIAGYKAVTTVSHPEYHTPETLDALQAYRDGGGRLLYLGGNGFYWRIARHQEVPGAIEIRRAEGGIRAWAAEPGEYFHAFDGGYGGLWRRNARPPQQLVGVGFAAQGQFEGSHYRRTADSYADDVAWIFDGIEGDVIGDCGLSGGGAAGYELDRIDFRLGTPDNVRLLARSEGHGESFMLVPEERLTHITTLAGEPVSQQLHADMIYCELPGGGAVFATGSITFCGSLPCKGFDNSVSRLLANLLDRFLS